MQKKLSFLLVCLFCALLYFSSTATSSAAVSVNGVRLYERGGFPHGKYLKIGELSAYPVGKINGTVYLVDEPVEFKDGGNAAKNGGYIYTAKIDHTIVGGFIKSIFDSEATKAVLKIRIPYNNPIYSGMTYKFTSVNPLTVLSKESKLDSDGKQFFIYNCVFQGYLYLHGVRTPAK